MKTCVGCKHAKWQLTANGRLHPSGDGRCVYDYRVPPLPAAYYWIGRGAATPSGGSINRREGLKDHCPYFTRLMEQP